MATAEVRPSSLPPAPLEGLVAGPALDAIRLIRATDSAEVTAIREFRSRVFLERSSLILDDDPSIDQRGYLFALQRGPEILACVRVLVLPDAEAGISRFDHPLAIAHGMQSEVGRVAVAPKRSARLLLSLLGLGAQWLCEHTAWETFVAYCRPNLVPLYERVGATDLGVDVARPGAHHSYRIVTGRYDVAASRALALLARSSRSTQSREGSGQARSAVSRLAEAPGLGPGVGDASSVHERGAA